MLSPCHQVWEGPWAWGRGWYAISSQSGQVGSQEGRAETRFPLLKVPPATRQRKIRRQEGGRPPESTPAPEIAGGQGAEPRGSVHYRTQGSNDSDWTLCHPLPWPSLCPGLSRMHPVVLLFCHFPPPSRCPPLPPPGSPQPGWEGGPRALGSTQCRRGSVRQGPGPSRMWQAERTPVGFQRQGKRGPEPCQLDTIS